MKLIGQVKLIEKGNKMEYGLYTGEEFINLNDKLNTYLYQEVEIEIFKKDNNLFYKDRGVLTYQNHNGIYQYGIENLNTLDEMLWELADLNTKVEINVSVLGGKVNA